MASSSSSIQAAGHPGAQSGNGLFFKPTNEKEIRFYSEMVARRSPLLEIVPTFMGTLEPQEGGKPCVVLEDILEEYVNPSVMDIKIGSVLWDEDADAAKVARLRAVSESTTSGSLGFRVAGISVVERDGQRKQYGKEHGRHPQCTPETIGDYIAPFFPTEDEYTDAVREAMGKHLERMVEVVAGAGVEMHSASVLFVYEGDAAALRFKVDAGERERDAREGEREGRQREDEGREGREGDEAPHEAPDEGLSDDSDSEKESKNGIVTVKLIDFGHARFVEEPYWDFIKGMQSLRDVWQRLGRARASE